jgi:Phosphotransferase enzyme family
VCNSPHARYRDRLTLLSSDALLTQTITAVGSDRGWWPELSWSRMSARFAPDGRPFGHFLFSHHGPPQAICRVEAFDDRPAPADADAPCVRTAAGWLRLSRFPCDAELPALPALLAAPGRATVVRYHPGSRCTIRVEQDAHTRFAKVYAGNRGRRVHDAGIALWEAVHCGRLELIVAQPDRWDPQTRTLWQHELAGAPVRDRLSGPDGGLLAHRIGRALASLTRVHLPVVDADLADGAAQMRRSARHGAELSRLVPRLAASTAALLERLAAVHAQAVPRASTPIHGAAHPNQWLDDGSQLGLVDFDRLSIGDPEIDAGVFLGDLEADGSLKPSVAETGRAFLAGYEEVAGTLDRRLVLANQVHQQLSSALRAARSVRADGDDRAERKLRRAIRALNEGSNREMAVVS